MLYRIISNKSYRKDFMDGNLMEITKVGAARLHYSIKVVSAGLRVESE